MKNFLSCDWGTSSFRLKLVDAGTLEVIADVHTNHGIAATNLEWQNQSKGQSRFQFFASVIASAIDTLEKKLSKPLARMPVILSGMASSSLGMIQLPYKKMPFKTDGSDLKVEHVRASGEFDHDVFVISGVCSENDVMRGEETQLVGCADQSSGSDMIYILPGTHSKHISVRDDVAYGFRTYMTGEIFSLLSKNSTLTEAVKTISAGASNDTNVEAFVAGVKESVNSNLLNKLFRTRTRFLLDKLSPEHNLSFLSGLLIGYEVNEVSHQKADGIVVVSSNMADHYKIAIQTLNIDIPSSIRRDDDVSIRGQLKIFSDRLPGYLAT